MKVYEFKILDHEYPYDPYIQLYKSLPTIEDMKKYIQDNFGDENNLLLSLNEVIVDGYAQSENHNISVNIIEVIENGN